jgi:hypothetical protein
MQRMVMIGILMGAAGVAAAENNHCELAVTGDATSTIKSDAPAGGAQGKLAASTDYWLSDDQLRTALRVMGDLGKASAAEKDKKLDEAMKKDPRFMLLMLNCLADDGGVILSPGGKAKYADVPMKPATYPLVPSDKAKAGEFTGMFHLSPGGKRESYTISDAGKLVITQFDRKAIAGTFSFGATQRKTSKHVTVNGSFRYLCQGERCDK